MSGTTEIEVPQSTLLDRPDGDPAPAPVENPRDAMMRRIAERYDGDQRSAEIEHGETLLREAADREPPEVEEAVSDEPPAVVAADPAQPAPSPAYAPTAAPAPVPTAATVPVPVAAPTLHNVTLPNGQVYQVTTDQLLHLASTGAAALSMQQQPQPVVQATPEPTPLVDRDTAAHFVQRLSYGSPDDGAAAVQDLVNAIAARMQPQVDAGQIEQRAAAVALRQIQTQQELNTVGQEYQDLFGDPSRQWTPEEQEVYYGRTILAATHLNRIQQRDAMLGVQRPQIEQYREAASKARATLAPQQFQPGPSGDRAVVQAAPQTERLERKRAAPRNVVGVSRAASLGEAPQQASTGSQIVEQMRLQRQQAVH